MATRAEHAGRKNRESLTKRLGKVALAIRARDAHRCVYCGQDEASSGAHLHLDHITPRNHGGADEPTNLVVACRRCNSARRDLTLAQWSALASTVYGLTFSPSRIRGQARRMLPC